MWEQPGVQCYPVINPKLRRKGLEWGQRLIEVPSKEESSKKKTKPNKFLQYFSICSSVSAVFCVACTASPFPVTLRSHFRYPLAPVLMSAGSVRSAHLSQNWWPVRMTSLNTQMEDIKTCKCLPLHSQKRYIKQRLCCQEDCAEMYFF